MSFCDDREGQFESTSLLSFLLRTAHPVWLA